MMEQLDKALSYIIECFIVTVMVVGILAMLASVIGGWFEND